MRALDRHEQRVVVEPGGIFSAPRVERGAIGGRGPRPEMVESRAQHGLEGRDGGGTITIVARDLDRECEITIEDDGLGNDPAKINGLGRERRHVSQIIGVEQTVSQQTIGADQERVAGKGREALIG